MSKCPKRDRRVADIGEVGEHHLQERDIRDDGRRDGRDEQENRCGKEQKGANMVEDAGLVEGHLDILEQDEV